MNEKNLSLAHRADFRQMLGNGQAIADDIEAAAKHLAEKMQRVHGGDPIILIDHEPGSGFVLIRIRRQG